MPQGVMLVLKRTLVRLAADQTQDNGRAEAMGGLQLTWTRSPTGYKRVVWSTPEHLKEKEHMVEIVQINVVRT